MISNDSLRLQIVNDYFTDILEFVYTDMKEDTGHRPDIYRMCAMCDLGCEQVGEEFECPTCERIFHKSCERSVSKGNSFKIFGIVVPCNRNGCQMETQNELQ